MPSSLLPASQVDRPLQPHEAIGLSVLAGFGSLSLAAVLFVVGAFVVMAGRRSRRKNVYPMTHLVAFFGSLLFSNALQAFGNVMGMSWVVRSTVHFGHFCSAQGAIKQTSDLGVSLWSLVLSYHAFTILFLRWEPRKWTAYVTFIAVWFIIALMVGIIPLAIKRPGVPYFGISGYWCWITSDYSTPRIVLEYVWMYISVLISFVLYTLIFFRLRGNLNVEGWRMSFRWVSSAETWQLQLGRDLIDTHMLKVAKLMLWYPVASFILNVPITIVRLLEHNGLSIPFTAVMVCAVIFTLSGFINANLLISARNLLPEEGTLPTVNMKRSPLLKEKSPSNGIIPFILPPPEETASNRHVPTDLSRQTSAGSVSTVRTTPFD